MELEILGKPPYLGKRKKQYIRSLDDELGEGNWEFIWIWGNDLLKKEMAYALYEDAYYWDSVKRHELWEELAETARNVYNNAKSNVDSGFDYLIQETPGTHLQDIAVRRVFVRRSWEFEGSELIQIRTTSKSEIGRQLSPNNVKFHNPGRINKKVEIYNPAGIEVKKEWWKPESTEDFYQNNRRVVKVI